tara:strand:- start:902 stop:1255 length:354 start_codon:yes stop_codon:yes gene_type:complete
MKSEILIILSLLVLAILLISCNPEELPPTGEAISTESSRFFCYDPDDKISRSDSHTERGLTKLMNEQGFLQEQRVDACKDESTLIEYRCELTEAGEEIILGEEANCAGSCVKGRCVE